MENDASIKSIFNTKNLVDNFYLFVISTLCDNKVKIYWKYSTTHMTSHYVKNYYFEIL